MKFIAISFVAMAVVLVPFAAALAADDARSKLVSVGRDGKLHYTPDEMGNTIPDFSNCGYLGGGAALPDAPVRLTLAPSPGAKDDTARIQKAIDQLAKMPPDAHGIRGALLLKRGKYRIADSLKITVNGIVLRGEGDGEDGTILIGTGTKQRDLIDIKGKGGLIEQEKTRRMVADTYVPVGARSFNVTDASGFKVGDGVCVRRIGNTEWIHFIAMDRIQGRPGNEKSTKQWTAFALEFDRIITAIDGKKVTIDAPITCAMDQRWGGGTVAVATDEGRIEQVGIENIRGDSEFDPKVIKEREGKKYPADENHAMYLASLSNVKNAWVKNCTAIHFYNGTVAARGGSKWVTVQDCTSLEPVSEITGGRRYPFMIQSQLILMQRCKSDKGRHAFVFQSRVCGPNAFVDCTSTTDYATSEPHHRWSVGGLYDNVHAHMAFQDRQYMGSGHGWAGANYVAWNCEGTMVLQQPPTAQNWSIGFVGKKEKGAFDRPDGYWESLGQHVEPRSLYQKQLEDRLATQSVSHAMEKAK